jgi:hypothetical protein
MVRASGDEFDGKLERRIIVKGPSRLRDTIAACRPVLSALVSVKQSASRRGSSSRFARSIRRPERMKAQARLDDFLSRGIIPEDLKQGSGE